MKDGALLKHDYETGAALTDVLAEAAYAEYVEAPASLEQLPDGAHYLAWHELDHGTQIAWRAVAGAVVQGFMRARALYGL